MLKAGICAIILAILGTILVAQDNGYITDDKERMRAPMPWPSAQLRAEYKIKTTPVPSQIYPDAKPRAAFAPAMSPSTQIGAQFGYTSPADIARDLRALQQLAIEENAASTSAAIDALIKKYHELEKSK